MIETETIEHKFDINPKSKEWKTILKRIFKRDDNKCRCCESKLDLSIHHIISRKNNGGNNDDNLIVFCRSCHDKVELHDISIESARNGILAPIKKRNKFKEKIEMYGLRDSQIIFLGYRHE